MAWHKIHQTPAHIPPDKFVVQLSHSILTPYADQPYVNALMDIDFNLDSPHYEVWAHLSVRTERSWSCAHSFQVSYGALSEVRKDIEEYYLEWEEKAIERANLFLSSPAEQFIAAILSDEGRTMFVRRCSTGIVCV